MYNRNMEIWAHTLVKNEARWLWFSVVSVINHVDKILLWDSGSTDGTLEIIQELRKKYPGKIHFQKKEIGTPEEFAKVRQEMLDETKSDWFIVLDGDEIWWDDSIKKVVNEIKKNGNKIESVVVPTINLVGDIFHYQTKSGGKYQFGNLKGHYNLRVVKRNIPGLHSQGVHGVWGWADEKDNQIQNRGTFKFVDAPYMHMTHLTRSDTVEGDRNVIKRKKKLKYELGKSFPLDFYYPEVFFKENPDFIKSPWEAASSSYKFRAFFETPLKLIKRKLWKEKAGY